MPRASNVVVVYTVVDRSKCVSTPSNRGVECGMEDGTHMWARSYWPNGSVPGCDGGEERLSEKRGPCYCTATVYAHVVQNLCHMCRSSDALRISSVTEER